MRERERERVCVVCMSGEREGGQWEMGAGWLTDDIDVHPFLCLPVAGMTASARSCCLPRCPHSLTDCLPTMLKTWLESESPFWSHS